MSPVVVALFLLAGTALTGLVSWLVARLPKSGRIRTTEAETLWEESQSMRTELRNEIAELRKEVKECHGESGKLKERLAALEKIQAQRTE